VVGAENAVTVQDLHLWWGATHALQGVSFDVPKCSIVAVIGPAGSGKSSLVSALGRGTDFVPGSRTSGSVLLGGVDVRTIPDTVLRRRVATVLPLPVGLPMSVYENVALAPRMAGLRDRASLDALVERCLRQAALWDEVKDRLDTLGTRLSGGQQQRLTLARALSTDPDVLCLDEFSIAIDPVTTMRIEAVLTDLKQHITIVLVTNLLAQARRIADRTIFLLRGHIVEQGPTDAMFQRATDPRTRAYVDGAFG
jgi:phosphate transport system ATP-binding protein